MNETKWPMENKSTTCTSKHVLYAYTSHRKHDASFTWINSNEAWRLKVKG